MPLPSGNIIFLHFKVESCNLVTFGIFLHTHTHTHTNHDLSQDNGLFAFFLSSLFYSFSQLSFSRRGTGNSVSFLTDGHMTGDTTGIKKERSKQGETKL